MKTDVHWKKIGLVPHHGICVPLSALRTKKSCGIGEFNDLIPLIDWSKKLKLDCIQLLPLNDTGNDPSPYNPISACALDPIYLSLSDLVDGEPLDEFIPLTQAPRLMRKEVKDLKLKWLWKYYKRTFPQLGYHSFIERNQWLNSYALFMARQEYQEPDFHRYIQFLCFDQLEKVKAYATKEGLFLMGDLPILLSIDSADVWSEGELFDLNFSAGAPPDAYNLKGQKWGFPLFNWEMMRKNNFEWWKRKLSIMGRFFHMYRIDHVVGFFRIWGIPREGEPDEGRFIPADQNEWATHGLKLLEMMIDASPLLPIAEDLGTVPEEVDPILKELGICSTKVIRWQRDGQTYIPYENYEPYSLTTVSTPDMPTLEMWWRSYPAESVLFAEFKHWPYHPLLSNIQRFEILHDAHHTPSYFHINLLQEYLAFFPELVREDERINIPGTLSPANWTYRYRPYLEEMVAHVELNQIFEKILN